MGGWGGCSLKTDGEGPGSKGRQWEGGASERLHQRISHGTLNLEPLALVCLLRFQAKFGSLLYFCIPVFLLLSGSYSLLPPQA